jgi:hypothetical protein
MSLLEPSTPETHIPAYAIVQPLLLPEQYRLKIWNEVGQVLMSLLGPTMVEPNTITTILPHAMEFPVVSWRELQRATGFATPDKAREIAEEILANRAPAESIKRVPLGRFALNHDRDNWELKLRATAQENRALRAQAAAYSLAACQLSNATPITPRKTIGATVARINIGHRAIPEQISRQITKNQVFRHLLPPNTNLPLGEPLLVDTAAPGRTFVIDSVVAAAWAATE